MQTLRDLELLLASRTPLVIVESLEEKRITQLFPVLGLRLRVPVFQWTVTDGLRRLEIDFGPKGLHPDPTDALRHIRSEAEPAIYLLLDFHPYLSNPLHIRLIKEIAQNYDEIPKTLVFLSFELAIPSEIRHLTARFIVRLPGRNEIKRIIKEEAEAWQLRASRPVKADPKAVEALATHLLGVTTSDTRRLIRNAIADDGAIRQDDLPRVMQAKYELISRGGIISFEYDTAKFSDVAGLNRMKEWLEHRRSRFHDQDSTLDQPRGIMLLGVQGAGKSLAAKAVAGSLQLPLLRLDFGTLYNKYIGESEKNLRHALSITETMSPCVLWIDEIEKGISVNGSDDGVSQRILGTLLTWMAEHNTGVFVVATANDIQRLPPELIRKGRLDEIFFVDLPGNGQRREIFSIHLRRRNQAPGGFDLDTLAQISDGFTGAEIEQAIVSALYRSQSDETGLTTEHLIEELERTSPLSVVMAERISELREWAAGRTVPAD
ncbi:MAG: AAA family ATPase [Gammaproteobacteria bacterium]|nr:AAA family ATPase [Gammaproteobacteria bacterium]